MGTEQQQQHPLKITIKTKGIADIKKFLTNKKRERAARLGEFRDKKTKPAATHTQPITKFLSSARTGVLDGIIGRDEHKGLQTSAAKGISSSLV